MNDNEPVFKPFRTTVTVPEDSRPGVIETVEAYDPDLGQFGQVAYSLTELDKEPGPETFSIENVDGRGVISLMARLDYEKKSLYHLRILATVSCEAARCLFTPLIKRQSALTGPRRAGVY